MLCVLADGCLCTGSGHRIGNADLSKVAQGLHGPCLSDSVDGTSRVRARELEGYRFCVDNSHVPSIVSASGTDQPSVSCLGSSLFRGRCFILFAFQALRICVTCSRNISAFSFVVYRHVRFHAQDPQEPLVTQLPLPKHTVTQSLSMTMHSGTEKGAVPTCHRRPFSPASMRRNPRVQVHLTRHSDSQMDSYPNILAALYSAALNIDTESHCSSSHALFVLKTRRIRHADVLILCFS